MEEKESNVVVVNEKSEVKNEQLSNEGETSTSKDTSNVVASSTDAIKEFSALKLDTSVVAPSTSGANKETSTSKLDTSDASASVCSVSKETSTLKLDTSEAAASVCSVSKETSTLKLDTSDAAASICSVSKETSTLKLDTSDAAASTSDASKDPTQSFDSNSNGKKTKKSKQNWKNRFPKQKQKGSCAQETCENNLNRRPFHSNYKYRGGRKRSQSFAAGSKFFLPYKRPRKETFIPPTKFLLGGNISDPLNLNSLQDEDVNRAMNAFTPKSSPLPTPPRHRAKIEVIIPPDIRDPLNLLNPVDNAEYEKQLEVKKPRRPRKKCKSKRRSESTNVPIEGPPPASPVKEESSRPSETTEGKILEASTSTPSTSGAAKDLKLDLSHIRGQKRTISESECSSKGKDGKKRRMDFLDKIVSPVIPQPGAWMRVHPRGGGHVGRGGGRGGHQGKGRNSISKSGSTSTDPSTTPTVKLPNFRIQDAKYQYGNYDSYYGYRNLDSMIDIRLKVFGLNRHLFNNKDILDIGCNVGHISIAVARDLGAKSVTGIDIDKNLIARARKNIKHYVLVPPPGHTPPRDATNPSGDMSAQSEDPSGNKTIEDKDKTDHSEMGIDRSEHVTSTTMDNSVVASTSGTQDTKKESVTHQLAHKHKKIKRNRRSHHKHNLDLPKCYFPISCPILYGSAEVMGYPLEDTQSTFPQNIVFKQANYILKDENLIMAEPSQYDLILCLSVTKWFHLNWGDAGLKLAFKRMFAQLRPGGKLILEAQNWASYKKKKKLTEIIYKNYASIEFFPNKFREYLLSPEVGFSKCCVLGVPQHLSKGFRRPIHLYIKGDFTPSKVNWSDTYAPSSHHQMETNIENQPKKVYANAFSPSYHPSGYFWGEKTTLYGAATPYSPRLENTTNDESPFYNPRSDSYLPSYTSSSQTKTVYASLSSPQSDYGGTPAHVSEGGLSQTSAGVYASLTSPASPFLEPSPGNSGTPSHPFTPSHSASYDAQPSKKKVYASLHSPQEDRPPVYSPSVACPSRRTAPSGYSPLHTGATVPEMIDLDNTNSSDSLQAKVNYDHLTPTTSPIREIHNVEVVAKQSPKEASNDGE